MKISELNKLFHRNELVAIYEIDGNILYLKPLVKQMFGLSGNEMEELMAERIRIETGARIDMISYLNIDLE